LGGKKCTLFLENPYIYIYIFTILLSSCKRKDENNIEQPDSPTSDVGYSPSDPESSFSLTGIKSIIVVGDLDEDRGGDLNLSSESDSESSGTTAIVGVTVGAVSLIVGGLVGKGLASKISSKETVHVKETINVKETEEYKNLHSQMEKLLSEKNTADTQLTENFKKIKELQEVSENFRKIIEDKTVSNESLAKEIKKIEDLKNSISLEKERLESQNKQFQDEIKKLKSDGLDGKERIEKIVKLEKDIVRLSSLNKESETMIGQLSLDLNRAKMHLLMGQLERSSINIESKLSTAGFVFTNISNGGKRIQKGNQEIGVLYKGVIQLTPDYFDKSSKEFIDTLALSDRDKVVILVEGSNWLEIPGYKIEVQSRETKTDYEDKKYTIFSLKRENQTKIANLKSKTNIHWEQSPRYHDAIMSLPLKENEAKSLKIELEKTGIKVDMKASNSSPDKFRLYIDSSKLNDDLTQNQPEVYSPEQYRTVGAEKLHGAKDIPYDGKDWKQVNTDVDFSKDDTRYMVSLGGTTSREMLLFDRESDKIKRIYNQIKENSKGKTDIKEILEIVNKGIDDLTTKGDKWKGQSRRQIEDALDEDLRNFLKKKGGNSPKVSIDELIDQNLLVCRHKGLLAAHVMGKLIQDGILPPGKARQYRSLLDDGGAHSWSVYREDSTRDLWDVDPRWFQVKIIDQKSSIDETGYGSIAKATMVQRLNDIDYPK
jgi:hypothetical protein